MSSSHRDLTWKWVEWRVKLQIQFGLGYHGPKEFLLQMDITGIEESYGLSACINYAERVRKEPFILFCDAPWFHPQQFPCIEVSQKTEQDGTFNTNPFRKVFLGYSLFRL